ncbi:DNA recombination protein RmuC [Elusimicrobium posterum]|uniref:DNA recombination protein RmuC n=1 Tax=Elusimicrobium posterum TaxID=3116653 RepID=UPI003C7758B7
MTGSLFMPVIIGVVIIIVAGAAFAIGWFLGGKKNEAQIAVLQTRLEEQKKTEEAMLNSFKAVSAEALNVNNQSFLELAKATLEKYQEGAKGDLEKRQQAIDSLVKPVKETLDKFENKIGEMEKERRGAYDGLREQVQILLGTTQNLSNALTSSSARGRWGELQLKKIVELAGMQNYADFVEQESVTTSDGRLRPDLIVKLPGGSNIVVDSKAPVSKYLEAVEIKDPTAKAAKLKEFSVQIKEHIRSLSAKSYWEQFKPTPDFVVMFIAGESYFSAALEADPALIEFAVKDKVVIATPTTLISLLKAIAYGWRSAAVEENAKHITELGKELYDRVFTMSENFYKVGNSLKSAVNHYNATLGSYETRVLVTARKFNELEVSDKVIEPAIEKIVDVLPKKTSKDKEELF